MERHDVILRYRKIKQQWDSDADLPRILPDEYKSLCTKLAALESGAEFRVVNKTDELKSMIAYVGGQIPRCNFKANGELINPENGITYEKACSIAKQF